MRGIASASLLAIALLLVAATPTRAWHHGGHGRVFIAAGPAFWWGPPYPYWWYPPPYYAYSPPPVIIQEPPMYVQQQPPPAPIPPPQTYWYYCPSAKNYYPNVQACSEAWVKVPPRPE